MNGVEACYRRRDACARVARRVASDGSTLGRGWPAGGGRLPRRRRADEWEHPLCDVSVRFRNVSAEVRGLQLMCKLAFGGGGMRA